MNKSINFLKNTFTVPQIFDNNNNNIFGAIIFRLEMDPRDKKL